MKLTKKLWKGRFEVIRSGDYVSNGIFAVRDDVTDIGRALDSQDAVNGLIGKKLEYREIPAESIQSAINRARDIDKIYKVTNRLYDYDAVAGLVRVFEPTSGEGPEVYISELYYQSFKECFEDGLAYGTSDTAPLVSANNTVLIMPVRNP